MASEERPSGRWVDTWGSLSIRWKLTLLVLFTTVTALALVSGTFISYDRTSYRELVLEDLEGLAYVLGSNASASLSFKDKETAREILAALRVESELKSAAIYDADAQLFATYLREPNGTAPELVTSVSHVRRVADNEGIILVQRAIGVGKQQLGTIVLLSGTGMLDERRQSILRRTLVAGFITLLVAVGIVLPFTGIVRTLRTAVSIAQEAAKGNLTVKAEAPSGDEVGQVLRAIGRMTDSLGSLIGRVQRSCIQLTSASNRISASSGQLAATANEQAASTSEIVSTAKQISVTSQDLVKTMDEVAAMSEETAESAGTGREGLRRMESVMQQLEEATEASSSRLTVINEKAGEITKVVTTINKVADQTNLLSLNAAIEAEKAGEYGRGFAVVAREIRRLADQTAVATLDIKKVIDEMKSAVNVGVMRMEKFASEVKAGASEIRHVGEEFATVIERIQELSPRFEAVNEGMQAQAQGAQQISEAMVQLGDAAAHTVRSIEGTNEGLDELKVAARAIEEGISVFRVE